MLGDLMLVLTRAGEVSQAARVLRKLDAEQTEIVGVPDVRAVQGLFDMALVHQQTPVCTVSGGTRVGESGLRRRELGAPGD